MARKQRHNSDLILLLARGVPVADAARQSAVSVRTVHRRLALPEFQQAIRETRAKALEQSAGALAHATQRAAATLEKLLSDKASSIRLAAARSVFELAVRTREFVDFEERLSALEVRNGATNGH